jgi:hypothetical protein
LRGWPLREIERNVHLAEPQRVAFAALVIASRRLALSPSC